MWNKTEKHEILEKRALDTPSGINGSLTTTWRASVIGIWLRRVLLRYILLTGG